MAGGATLPHGAAHRHGLTVDGVELRGLVPRVLSVLVRRGADFATAEDAVQEALIKALSAWGDEPPRAPPGRGAQAPLNKALSVGGDRPPADPTGWLVTVAWRAFLDMTRSEVSRRN